MKIKGREKFAAQLAALPEAMKSEILKALKVSADETNDLQRRFAPVRSGALKASIGNVVGKGAPEEAGLAIEGAGELTATMFAGNKEAWYARLVEFGSPPHPIKAKRAKVLARDGEVFGTKVAHPGAHAFPFFYPGFRLGKKRAKARLARAVRNGAKKAFGK